MVLSNCAIYPAYRKPFDLIFDKAKTEEWARPERFELPTFWFVAR
jgi:hypothetical protein